MKGDGSKEMREAGREGGREKLEIGMGGMEGTGRCVKGGR